MPQRCRNGRASGAWIRGFCLVLSAACLSPGAAQTTSETTTTATTTTATTATATTTTATTATDGTEVIVEAVDTGPRTEDCCQVPQFGNENIAPELYECKGICEAMVPYTTTQSCALNQTCTYAMASYNTAYELALNRLSESRVCSTTQRVCFDGVTCLGGACREPPNDMSVACELTLRRAMCAYHFPRCIFDQLIISHEVCMELCDEVVAFCNFTIDEVVRVPKCVGRNFGCTGAAARLGACDAVLLTSLCAVLATLLAGRV
mmetsp:Transcript_1518/g.3680  ORF Transcript_1518/g.3680 Transcript_1518/m.3680 type:complete len:263 (+) Transcript_1518:2-790(+)